MCTLTSKSYHDIYITLLFDYEKPKAFKTQESIFAGGLVCTRNHWRHVVLTSSNVPLVRARFGVLFYDMRNVWLMLYRYHPSDKGKVKEILKTG